MYVCDWIHNVLIIMLVFVENGKMVTISNCSEFCMNLEFLNSNLIGLTFPLLL